MINLTNRSDKKEILDNANIPFADIKQNMKELNTINTYLGGHKITIAGLEALIEKQIVTKPISICEIGCGGGDNIVAINEFCISRNIPVTFIGIDIKPECIAFAKDQHIFLNVNWITNDYKKVYFSEARPDIIFSSLFCHHFNETELNSMLQWMKQNAALGFFINDLHRHPFAWYSIKWLTSLFSKSYLVKNDAPLSVARGFKKNEWKEILKTAGISNYSLTWKWAFRYLVICRNEL